MKKNQKYGFTLIELLIVIAIILILIAIALPNFLEAQIRAKVAAAKGTLKSVQVALESYGLDNKPYKEPRPNFNPALRNRYGPYPPYGVNRTGRTASLSCGTNYDPGCLNLLTTPVRYFVTTTSVIDPFQMAEGSANDDTSRRPFGYYNPGHKSVEGKFLFWHMANPQRRNPASFSDYWVYSVGPDSCSNADGDFMFCWTEDYRKTTSPMAPTGNTAPPMEAKVAGTSTCCRGLGSSTDLIIHLRSGFFPLRFFLSPYKIS
ncbi:MAG: prepilin-type N-terminal cleavage/methylation domain-containing protein [Candidatus Omnitrophica bacterium]|nr:prepilin-type N-terminal cleavage/methylation domain-containing protein [Candidatus Omnitrophota bacterium]